MPRRNVSKRADALAPFVARISADRCGRARTLISIRSVSLKNGWAQH
jgi:hypothetical protein